MGQYVNKTTAEKRMSRSPSLGLIHSCHTFNYMSPHMKLKWGSHRALFVYAMYRWQHGGLSLLVPVDSMDIRWKPFSIGGDYGILESTTEVVRDYIRVVKTDNPIHFYQTQAREQLDKLEVNIPKWNGVDARIPCKQVGIGDIAVAVFQLAKVGFEDSRMIGLKQSLTEQYNRLATAVGSPEISL